MTAVVPTPHTHLVPGDGVVEGVDGLVVVCNRVIVGHIKIGVFLHYVLGFPHGSSVADELGRARAQQQQRGQPRRVDTPSRGPPEVFMTGLPATPEHHIVYLRLSRPRTYT